MTRRRKLSFILVNAFFLVAVAAPLPAADNDAPPPVGEWQSMFDGESLNGWEVTPFSDPGEVRIEDGEIVLGAGNPFTGIDRTGWFPRSNYEVRFQGARLSGNDFFALVVFPVQDSYCSWVTGGWGGDIVGLSNVDGWDAADNETRTYFQFEQGRWYDLRLRVTDERIEAWIDDRRITRLDLEGRDISLRYGEDKLSIPFGLSSYYTTGAVRNLEYRVLAATD